MKVLVTGSSGFVGRNLMATMKTKDYEILSFDQENHRDELVDLTKDIDFVVHLAGVNRPQNTEEFYTGNTGLSEALVEALVQNKNFVPILVSSSIQASLDNDYGKSKLAGENVLRDYAAKYNAAVYIYRFSNLFGKWGRPNYNSVVATWCHDISRQKTLQVNDPSVVLNLMYIDDVIDEILRALGGKGTVDKEDIYTVPVSYDVSLQEIYDLLHQFQASRKNLLIPDMSDGFAKKLYSTYLSYLPQDQFAYDLKMNVDNRGSFTEVLKTTDRGQVSVNISKAGITKGQHWHHSKNEKFLVVKGEGVIRLRNINSDEIISYEVSDEILRIVDIPPGYTHSITNIGVSDMVTLMWVNEIFNPDTPDTYYEEV